ncbi:ABC transporter ATP-binding protein [Streptomyces sp. NPDC004031]
MTTARTGMPGDAVRLTALGKSYGSFTAVHPLDLAVPAGSFFALLGASGSGKTTTLRMIAGLEEPTTGTVALGGRDVTALPPHRRPVNTVFQNYALFPHLDVHENVAFGLRRRGVRDVRRQVAEMLELVQLEGLARRRPHQLSGGQQQRVALARAIVNKPEVLLLDEPLGALDLTLRRRMQLELKRIQTEVGITFVHVTHDQEEALTMADTVAVMNAGRIEQQGTPAGLYENPESTFVANFLGTCNLLPVEVTGTAGADLTLATAAGPLAVPAARCRAAAGRGTRVLAGVRPEKITLVHADDEAAIPAGRNRIAGRVTGSRFTGAATQFTVDAPGLAALHAVLPNVDHDPRIVPGAPVVLHWNPAHTFGLDAAQDAGAGREPGGDAGADTATGALGGAEGLEAAV